MTGWLVFISSVLALGGIYAVLTMVLNLQAGWAGLWDLSTAGMLAVGAYVYVLSTSPDTGLAFAADWPIPVAILAAGIVTAVVALLIGLPALRLRHEYFLITTFAFAEVIRQMLTNARDVTNGAAGIYPVSRPLQQQVGGAEYNYVLFGIVMALVVATYVLMRRIGRSPTGRALRALRDNEGAALALGKNVALLRAQAYVIGGFVIGIAGPTYVWYIRSISPELFAPTVTFTVWTALVIGGIGSFRGPVLGAFLLIAATESTQFFQISPSQAAFLASLEPLLLGIGLILVLRFRPQGLIDERRAFVPRKPKTARRDGGQGGAPTPVTRTERVMAR